MWQLVTAEERRALFHIGYSAARSARAAKWSNWVWPLKLQAERNLLTCSSIRHCRASLHTLHSQDCCIFQFVSRLWIHSGGLPPPQLKQKAALSLQLLLWQSWSPQNLHCYNDLSSAIKALLILISAAHQKWCAAFKGAPATLRWDHSRLHLIILKDNCCCFMAALVSLWTAVHGRFRARRSLILPTSTIVCLSPGDSIVDVRPPGGNSWSHIPVCSLHTDIRCSACLCCARPFEFKYGVCMGASGWA